LIRVLLFLLLSFSILSSNIVFAEEEAPYQIYINGEKFEYDYDPIVENDAIYVPMWGLLGKLMRFDLPKRILYSNVNSNIMYNIELTRANFTTKDGFEKAFERAEYPLISKNSVIYMPLTFLTTYMDITVNWGEDNKIDLTAGSFDTDTPWRNVYKTLYKTFDESSYKSFYEYRYLLSPNQRIWKLSDEAKAESYWSTNPNLWVNKHSLNYRWDKEHLKPLVVIGYTGLNVTLSDGEEQFDIKFDSLVSLTNAFYTNDPFQEYRWSETNKALVQDQQIRVGMNKDMVRIAWGEPNSVDTYTLRNNTVEQWVYKKGSYNYSFVLFVNNKVESITN
jgi:hypothetical protein